jgi:hypothetical protein
MGTLDGGIEKDLQFKQKDVDNTDTFPVVGWDPAGTKRVMLHNVMLFVNNKASSSTLQLKVEVDRKGTWHEVLVVGCRNQEMQTQTIDFKGLVKVKEIRIRKVGTSTNFNGTVTLTGEVVD